MEHGEKLTYFLQSISSIWKVELLSCLFCAGRSNKWQGVFQSGAEDKQIFQDTTTQIPCFNQVENPLDDEKQIYWLQNIPLCPHHELMILGSKWQIIFFNQVENHLDYKSLICWWLNAKRFGCEIRAIHTYICTIHRSSVLHKIYS